jgi:hypothetical protein
LKKLLSFLIFIPTICFVLEEKPWLGNVHEFYFLGKYSYSRFSSVDSSTQPLKNTSNDHNLCFDLDFCVSAYHSILAELEFMKTPRRSFGFSSAAFQWRFLCLDDLGGHFVSLVVGSNIRVVSKKSLTDISAYRSGEVEIEGNISIGKEFYKLEFWKVRVWGTGFLGIANRGSLWVRGILAFEGNSEDNYRWGALLKGSHGYGKKTVVDIDSFRGYGYIRHKNLDIGCFFGYRLDKLGTLFFSYERRLLAKRYPKNVNTFILSYFLPFSF